MAGIARTPEEIEAVADEAAARTAEGGSRYPGMTYEQGVRDALAWVMDDDADSPMED